MEKWDSLKLLNFEGPLDLLLHLIKEKKLNIVDINLADLTDQFVEYLINCQNLNIEIASEYLIMASYLVELKSKSLIPKEVVDVQSNYEDHNEKELMEKLIEYHKIKVLSEKMMEHQNLNAKGLFSKDKSSIELEKIDEDSLPLAETKINIDDFAKIFLSIIDKNKLKKPPIKTINQTEISPEQIAIEIQKIIDEKPDYQWTLEELLYEQNATIQTLVATFLAILDLTKNNQITINQINEIIYINKVKGRK